MVECRQEERERERVSDCVDGVCLVINVSVLCLARAYRKSYNYEKLIDTKMNDLDLCLEVV